MDNLDIDQYWATSFDQERLQQQMYIAAAQGDGRIRQVLDPDTLLDAQQRAAARDAAQLDFTIDSLPSRREITSWPILAKLLRLLDADVDVEALSLLHVPVRSERAGRPLKDRSLIISKAFIKQSELCPSVL